MSQEPSFDFEKLPACPLCEHRSSKTIFDRTLRGVPLTFVRCAGCSLVYQNPRMTKESLQDYFSSSFFIEDSKTKDVNFDELLGYYDYGTWDNSYRKTARFRLNHILNFKSPPADLLEIGSATGSFLDESRKTGFTVRGLDVSSSFAAMARKRGVEVDEGFIESYPLPAGQYDVICGFGGVTCWHDPVAGLKNIRSALKKDGIFVMNHMDVDNLFHKAQGFRNWDYQHPCLTLWSETTMRRCLKKAGFEVVLSQSERQYISLGRFFEYFKLPKLRKTVLRLKLGEWAFPAIIPFTKFVVSRPAP